MTLQLFVSGLPVGGMYALAALGIVLVYRTTGTFTFAQGAIATATAFVFNAVWAEQGLPLVVGVAAGLATATALGFLLERVVRCIDETQVLARAIATLGVSGLVLAACGAAFGYETRFVPQFLPHGTFGVAGVRVGWQQLGVVAVAGLLAVTVGLLLTRTRTGTALRAVSENRLAARLAGVPVQRLERLAWVGGAVLAGIAGMLLSPLVFLDTVQLSVFFLVKPFAAAVVGGLTSLSAAFGAALVIGVVESQITRVSTIPGLTEVVPFTVMLIALLARHRIATMAARPLVSTPARRPGTGRLWPGVAITAALIVLIPLLRPGDLTTLKLSAVFAVLALSLVVLTGWVGQVSLAQAALFGIGAFIGNNLANRAGLPFPAVLILAPLLVVPLAALVGLPALRFRGMLLAVVTLALGSVCFFSLFQWDGFTGGRDGSRVPAPSLFGFDLAQGNRFAYVIVLVAAAAFAAVRNFGRFSTGDGFFAARESEEAAAALGLSVTTDKLTAFALSGALAALAGVLYAYDAGVVSFDQFSPFLSFTIFTLVVMAGVESLWGAVLAGLLYAVPGQFLDALPGRIDAALIASFGVVVTLVLLPGGLVSLPDRLRPLVRRPKGRLIGGRAGLLTGERVP